MKQRGQLVGALNSTVVPRLPALEPPQPQVDKPEECPNITGIPLPPIRPQLPIITPADNGKFVGVVDGKYTLVNGSNYDDTEIREKIATETENRIQADDALQQQITAEVNDRTDADILMWEAVNQGFEYF